MQITNEFSKNNLWQSYLIVWSNMAIAQSEVGIIPEWAGKIISKNSKIENFNINKIENKNKKNKRIILSISEELSEKCGKAGDFVHWGATSRNIIETGYTLVFKESYKILLANLADIIFKISKISKIHSNSPMLGRTLKRNALPITFGFKTSGWIEELLRLYTRFEEAEKRVFTLKFGGAVGAMHGFDNKGKSFTNLLAQKLKLKNVLIPNRTSVDTRIEYIELLSILGMSIGKIANELYFLMQESINEIQEIETKGQFGSSTMPHKKNPYITPSIISNCSILRGKISSALESGLTSHEGDIVNDKIIDILYTESCPLSEEILSNFNQLLDILFIDTDKMMNNLNMANDYITSENLMLQLAKYIGRNKSHSLINKLINQAIIKNHSIRDTLKNSDKISNYFSEKDLTTLLDPKNYLGESINLSLKASKLGEKFSKKIKKRIHTDL